MRTDEGVKPEEYSVANILRNMYEQLKRGMQLEEERMKSPDWRYERVYIMSPELFELRHDLGTPLEVKQRIDIETFAGWQWVKDGPDED